MWRGSLVGRSVMVLGWELVGNDENLPSFGILNDLWEALCIFFEENLCDANVYM